MKKSLHSSWKFYKNSRGIQSCIISIKIPGEFSSHPQRSEFLQKIMEQSTKLTISILELSKKGFFAIEQPPPPPILLGF